VEKHSSELAEGKTLSYTVLRKDESGTRKEVELKAEVKKVSRPKKHILKFDSDASSSQLAIRKAWLTPQ
jgi:hypothetical protein